MEKHYIFKSLFEDNITQMSPIVLNAHLCTLSDIVHDFSQHIYWNLLNSLSDVILQLLYSCTTLILNGCNFKSSCKMGRTVLGLKCKATEWQGAER